ncbi:serine hydrolase domain-containing protein [Kineococcus sp. SYSU DK004]|uniref:serine hydrolase domain-containing protein n=1 Tax=Kineococcus sp. SYSU DK004 TaxID=3383125 RepID=UPI003D7C9CD7
MTSAAPTPPAAPTGTSSSDLPAGAPPHRLPRAAPAERGVDAAGVLALLDALESTPGVEPHSLLVVRGGAVVAEGWWAPYAADRVHLLYSLSKSFTATALGLLVDAGRVDLDDTLVSRFPELEADVTDPRSRAVRVRHVAAMASGHREETLERARALDPADLVRGFLLLRPDAEPGTVFAYNQPCTYSLAALVQRESGQRLTEFLRPRLFDPLGIGEVGWTADGSGREIGWSGLHARTEDVAALGELHLRGGRWGGRQLLSPEWVETATRSHVDSADGMPNPDWQRGYGFQFWRARHGYRGDGAYGQFCLVLPEQDAVVAITSQSPDMQAVLDAVWEHLLPALGVPASGERDAELARRLAGLALPPLTGEGAPDLPAQLAAGAAGVELVRAPGDAESSGDQPQLTSALLRPAGDAGDAGSGAWELQLREPGSVLTVPVVVDGWAEGDAVAATAAWRGGVLAVDVVLVETPHRLHVLADLTAGTFTARWGTRPLHGSPLTELRCPRP